MYSVIARTDGDLKPVRHRFLETARALLQTQIWGGEIGCLGRADTTAREREQIDYAGSMGL